MNSVQSLVNTSIKKITLIFNEGKRETNGGIHAKNDSQGSVWTWKGDKMAAVYC